MHIYRYEFCDSQHRDSSTFLTIIARNHLHKCTVKSYENVEIKEHVCKCVHIVTECTTCSLVTTGIIFSLQMNNLPALSQSSEVSFCSLINVNCSYATQNNGSSTAAYRVIPNLTTHCSHCIKYTNFPSTSTTIAIF
jgi:hypothetical protein